MISDRIQEILDRCIGPDVLDVGCSGGLQEDDPEVRSPLWLHGHLRAAYPRLWGIDLSDRRLAIMRESGHHNLVAMDAQALHDTQLDQLFDTIIAGEVIEHLENPGRLLTGASRHLKPGGRILLTTPYVFGIPVILYARLKFPKTCQNSEHMMWFCPTTISQLASRSGLEVKELVLISDYSFPHDGAIRPYFVMLRLFQAIRLLLPKRWFATAMLVVLQPNQRLSDQPES